MHIKIILECSEKKMPKYFFFGCFFSFQSSRCVSNEQPYLKTTGVYDDLVLLYSLFNIFYFILNTPFHLACFPISPFLVMFFLKPTKHSRKAFVNIYRDISSMYSLENL